MSLALTFATPLLLIGLLAAAIPFALHLLSSVRAQEVYFPTLRFLRASMEKTARRRRIQHWLLLLLRAALLALLALAVAQPISEATGGWLTGRRYAAAVVLDNSYSMAARSDGSTRFETARTEAAALLGGDDPPAVAALMETNGPGGDDQLTADLGALRERLAEVPIAMRRAPLAGRIRAATEMLQNDPAAKKTVYLFTDLQRVSCEELMTRQAPAGADDVHLLIVNTASGAPDNISIGGLEVEGLAIVDELLEITATLTNSAASERKVEVALRVGGVEVSRRVQRSLAAAGQQGARRTVRFYHRFSRPGPVTGEVFIDADDDLPLDNVRRFALDVGGRVRALIVRGPTHPGESQRLDPAMMLRIALDPFGNRAAPWSIEPRTVEGKQFAASDLDDADAAFFCGVESFTAEQAGAVERFVHRGGTAMFFLGPAVDVANYNARLGEGTSEPGGLLGARIGEPTGEVGPTAPAASTEWVDLEHPYLDGLFANEADYRVVLAQRYYRLESASPRLRTLIRLSTGDPLVTVRPYGGGHVLLCATTSSPRWSNFPISKLFLPMMTRASLLARRDADRRQTYLAGSRVAIEADAPADGEPAESIELRVTPPPGARRQNTPPIRARRQGDRYVAVFEDTATGGIYRWQVAGAGLEEPGQYGQFAVNPDPAEGQLAAVPADVLAAAMKNRGYARVYVAATVAEAQAAAAAESEGRNWWDLLLAVVICMLVVEAVVANRFRRADEQIVPAGLNPAIAPRR